MAAALVVLIAGSIVARFLARSVLIGAVNMNLQYARLLSVGVKWLVTVLAVTIAIERLGIGGGIIRLAFGILFGGIVLALALAVGLGSKELVSRSLERETSKTSSQNLKEPVGHLYEPPKVKCDVAGIDTTYAAAIESLSQCSTPRGLKASGRAVGHHQIWARDSMIALVGARFARNNQIQEALAASLSLLKDHRGAGGAIPNNVDCATLQPISAPTPTADCGG